MRWWIHTDPPSIMSIDNASVQGMDFSGLLADKPDLWMVQWIDGKGEIERQDVANDANLNGLREAFIDITPYAPYFQQFLQLCPGLLLDQAKKVQIELINELYNTKRQLPYHYVVAAGDYWWDASDATMNVSSGVAVQNAISKVNEVIGRLNSLVLSINSVDTAIWTSVNSNVVAPTNSAIAHIDTQLGNTYVNFSRTDGFINYIRDEVVGSAGHSSTGPNTINYRLIQESIQGYAVGFIDYVRQETVPFETVDYSNPYSCSNISSTPISWSDITNVATTNQQWIPVGGTTPVNVTPAEQLAIMNGIAARTNQLSLVRNTKIAEVNALTTIPAVIAYDVLAGWPVIPLPPGWTPALAPPGGGGGNNVAIVGTPPAPTTGVPEAPSDGITYGRRNAIWNPALAMSGDILDGGNF